LSTLSFPCKTKMIINAGITRVIYGEGYADELAREMITESGITTCRFTPENAEQLP
jgi:dCMP deaminase